MGKKINYSKLIWAWNKKKKKQKKKKLNFFFNFHIYKHLKFHAYLGWAWKKSFIISGPDI